MGWFGPIGNCSCGCGECTCEDARAHFISTLGLSSVQQSGGLNYGVVGEVDTPLSLCNGGTEPLDPPPDVSIDLSAVKSSALSLINCKTDQANVVCAPVGFGRGWYTDDNCGTFGKYAWRGFAPEPRFGCMSGHQVAWMRSAVSFSCDANGEFDYLLQIACGYRYMIETLNGAVVPAAWSLPTSGVDWTRTVTGFGVGQRTEFTRNSGDASVAFILRSSQNTTQAYDVVSHASVSAPATSVSLWIPNPVVDYTGITEHGTNGTVVLESAQNWPICKSTISFKLFDAG